MKGSSIVFAAALVLNGISAGKALELGADSRQGAKAARVFHSAGTFNPERIANPDQGDGSRSVPIGGGQQGEKGERTVAKPDRFGLEIVAADEHAPSYMTVAPAGSNRIPSWKAPANMLSVSAVKFAAIMEGEAVRVKVSVLLGQYHDKEKTVATYLMRENETISTQELSGFGAVPFNIKVVKLKPWSGVPPAITNKSRSLEVVSVEGQATLFPAFKVTVKNTSSKNVIALDINVSVPKGGPLLSRPQAVEGKSLIDPGALYDFFARSGDGGEMAREGYEPQPPTGIVINSVMFADGTYEGELGPALDQFAIVAGNSAQLPRVLGLLDAALEADGSGVRNLRTQISALPDDIEATAMEGALARYPLLAQAPGPKTVAMFKHGVHRVKQLLVEDIKTFEKNHAQASREEARAWLEVTRQKYADWLAKL
jgi:hypothetical protein